MYKTDDCYIMSGGSKNDGRNTDGDVSGLAPATLSLGNGDQKSGDVRLVVVRVQSQRLAERPPCKRPLVNNSCLVDIDEGSNLFAIGSAIAEHGAMEGVSTLFEAE